VGQLLKRADDAEKVHGGRIAPWAEHAHQALRRHFGPLGERLESDGRVDVVAQNRFRGGEFALDQRLHRFLKQGLAEFRIPLDARLDEFLKAAGQRHGVLVL
jgi:hypothetical protein